MRHVDTAVESPAISAVSLASRVDACATDHKGGSGAIFGVFDLAAAYEARFKETMTDDYSVENSNQKEI